MGGGVLWEGEEGVGGWGWVVRGGIGEGDVVHKVV